MAITRNSSNSSARASLTKVKLYYTHNGPSANPFSPISTELRQQQQCGAKRLRRSQRVVSLTCTTTRATPSSKKPPAITTKSVVDPSQARSCRIQKSKPPQRDKPSCEPSSNPPAHDYTTVLNRWNIALTQYANIILDKSELLDVLGRHSSHESQYRTGLAAADTETFNHFIMEYGKMVADDKPKLCVHPIIRRLNVIVLGRTGGEEVTGMRPGMMVRYAEC
ncbi:hypothetical protein FAGAP_4393 [Fusarium agapanthi]|uniref:Uncharacterized protein n=1 Tax=Fusarium agapanthi TaxID=1803897 RepID=A0A9P5BF84_9HYPO|nr:hypothetical protein FAGAP_4393 [Fusarium agapanthi]